MLKQRVATAFALLAVLIPVLFYLPAFVAVASFAVVAALAAWEWSRLASPNRSARLVFPLVVLALSGLCLRYPQAQPWLCLVAASFWLCVPLWLRRRWNLPAGPTGFVIGAIVLVPAWVGMVRLHAQGPWVLLAAMTLVWVADIAAYFVGRAFGRHKLAPAVSPGKTWEGAAGAVLGGLIYAFLLQRCTELPLPSSNVVLGVATLLLVAVSIVGDLFESMIKRQAGVKDSSQLLPGHGGILDRIDSLTSSLPVLIAASYFWPV